MVMIAPSETDYRVCVRSSSSKITLLYTDVSVSARALERSHLCGPTAGLIQGEALAGVALLGQELSAPEETVTFRMKVDGPLGGVLVEADVKGNLRGFTRTKVMNDLDGMDEPDLAKALGKTAQYEIIQSAPGRLLSCGHGESQTADITCVLEDYFQKSLQREVAVEVSALGSGGYIDSARGLSVECMPDGDEGMYERLLRYFDDETVADCLDDATPLPAICKILGFDAPVYSKPFPLRFACHCSPERVEGMIAAMPADDLKDMIAEGKPAEVYCHFCGKGYTVGVDRLQHILDEKKSK
jgi:molecular chaperone Hsp33